MVERWNTSPNCKFYASLFNAAWGARELEAPLAEGSDDLSPVATAVSGAFDAAAPFVVTSPLCCLSMIFLYISCSLPAIVSDPSVDTAGQ